MFSFLSGVYVYVIAWALLGQDSGDSLGPTHLKDFAVSKIKGHESITLSFFEKFIRFERAIVRINNDAESLVHSEV